jgi:hypothetical protein
MWKRTKPTRSRRGQSEGNRTGPVRPVLPDAMKTKTTKPAEFDNLSAVEKKHLLTIRSLSTLRHRAILRMARVLLQRDMETGTARIENPIAKFNRLVGEIVATEKAVKAGRHLRLVVDNDRAKP